ncbi:DUF4255 domain-containing protein [Nocardioides sp. cx-169]|uniref:Pvc16 family protein n=1 Tax=Nocardioides sp. cx-169 TaxID=2899080 RepID=UPI001E5E4261|nr:Pvc16 family protein [Nocardioides sp. cx-169]MCD4536383.1 DUF4255 domain-containing protein [Nocardioides sp. cx-169]
MINEVTRALVAHLHSRTPDLGSWVVVHSLSAADAAPAKDKLALCLLAVDEHDHLRNSPPVEVAGRLQRAPMQLRLSYLVTYFGPHDEAMARLTRVIAVFHTTPVLGQDELPLTLGEQVERVTVRLRNTTADERNQVWSVLGRPGRLALFYTVDVAPVRLLPGLDGDGRVLAHRIDLAGTP